MPRPDKKQALATVNKAFDTFADARKPYEKKWDEFHRIAESVPGKIKHKWMSNRFIPYTATLIDLVHPRLAAKRPSAMVVGLNPESQLKEQKFNNLIDHEQDMMKVEKIFANWTYDATKYGTSYIQIGWKKETSKNIPHTAKFLDKMKAYFKGLGLSISNDDILYDGPTLENVDVYDLFIHPKAQDFDDATAVVKRIEMTKYQMLQNPNLDRDAIKKLQGGNVEVDKYRKNRLQAEGLTSTQASKIVDSMSDQYHEYLEYYGLFDIDNDGEDEECIIGVADRIEVVRLEESPYFGFKKPFVKLVYQPKPNFFYGRGIPERVMSLQLELNDIANQASDNRKLTNMPVMKVKKQANLQIENLKYAPGVPLVLEDVNDLVFDRPPDFTNSLEFMARVTREMMQVAVGANDVVIGNSDAGIASDTLGGAQIAQEQATLRFLVPVLMLDIAIEQYGNMLIALNQQNHDRSKTIRSFGDAGIEYNSIAPRDLAGNFSYKVQTGSMMPQSKGVKQQQMINLLKLAQENQNLDQEKIWRMVIESFDVDYDAISQPKPESMANLEQFRQLPPEQQQAFLAQMSPEDQAIMKRALMNKPQVPQNAPAVS